MTLPDAVVKILSTLGVALLGYLLKNLSKFQLFTSFRRLSTTDKSRLFSLLYKSNEGFINNYKIQTQMLNYGIRYSAQFMKNLFYYAHKNNIRADNKDLSAFLSLPGLFICKDNGEVGLQKGARLLSFFIFFLSSVTMVTVTSFLPESIHNLPISIAKALCFTITRCGINSVLHYWFNYFFSDCLYDFIPIYPCFQVCKRLQGSVGAKRFV